MVWLGYEQWRALVSFRRFLVLLVELGRKEFGYCQAFMLNAFLRADFQNCQDPYTKARVVLAAKAYAEVSSFSF